ncbi:MAG: tyrosine-type recombinase/integrase, partial [Candidatus Dormibacteraeota bacterium]|nr:tyrosine-type recombinase/integrase [Candidatus Dormibacteraeota bacterium]
MARASQGITWMERSRRWQLRLFEGGQLLYLRYFSVRAYGSKAAALYAAERDRAEQLTHHSRGDPLHPERVTVDQLLDQVIAAKQHWQSADELPGRVLQIRHHLGARSACEVSDADVSALQRLLLDYYAPKTVRHGMLLLRQALQRGVEQRLLLTNPACKVRLPTPPRRQGRFTPREVQLLLEAAGDTWLHPAICLMADCALRPGEVCALRWDDIHPQWRNLHVQRSRATLRATKTPRGDRVVPLTSRLRASLQTWRPLCRSCEWVFPALNGADLPLRVQTLDDHFGQLLVRAGVRPRRAYDLRR